MPPRLRRKSGGSDVTLSRYELICAVGMEPALYQRSASTADKTAAWKNVASICKVSEEACQQDWQLIIAEHAEELKMRASETSTGSGSAQRATCCQNFDDLAFLREGIPKRRSVSSSEPQSLPFRDGLPCLSPPAAKRKRTPSETLNQKLEECLNSVTHSLKTPTSVEFALGVEIGKTLDALPDGTLKWTWREKGNAFLTVLQKEAAALEKTTLKPPHASKKK